MLHHQHYLQAILESEPFSITLKTVDSAKLLGEDLAKELGCSDLDCLHSKVTVISIQNKFSSLVN